MRKKTEPNNSRKHGSASQPKQGGLIVNGAKKAQQSAKDSYALDNCSHRTIALIERLADKPPGASGMLKLRWMPAPPVGLIRSLDHGRRGTMRQNRKRAFG
jgi:hypothetical protein